MTRHFLLMSSAAFFLGTISAVAADKPAPTPLSDIYACTEITDNSRRLACYDAAAGKLRAAEKVGEFVAVKREDIKTIKKEAFGFNMPSLPKLKLFFLKGKKAENAFAQVDTSKKGSVILEQDKNGEISKVEYGIDHIVTKAYGVHWFYLKNGQVWKQIDSLGVRYSKKNKNLMAQIRTASMGTYFLRINGRGRAIRVKRYK